MSKSIDHDKICLRFSEKRKENILIYSNQREIKIISVEILIRRNEKRLKYDS